MHGESAEITAKIKEIEADTERLYLSTGHWPAASNYATMRAIVRDRHATNMNLLSNLFVPFAVRYMGQPLKVDYLYAGLCRMDAAYLFFWASWWERDSSRDESRSHHHFAVQ